MNNKDFIAELAKRTNRTVSDTTKTIDDFESLLKSHLEENDSIAATGFGIFEVKKKMERVSVNPTTGKRYLIPPKLTLAFKQSGSLKERFNEAEVEVPDENEEENIDQ
ncbi:MAG: HU family DNA-binding protein [Bacteroidaceae bacterium]|nr:HU family DNA-binding protein [Bacteroidaceae bacterium]